MFLKIKKLKNRLNENWNLLLGKENISCKYTQIDQTGLSFDKKTDYVEYIIQNGFLHSSYKNENSPVIPSCLFWSKIYYEGECAGSVFAFVIFKYLFFIHNRFS